MKYFNDARDDFWQKRLGMFVHWGVYSINAWHEQELWRHPGAERETYETLMRQFNPEKFDPHQWIDAAEAAGMEYICFTTKHHDGFCMWDSEFTEYKITNTPYKKDILALLAKACEERNMPLGLYYSLPDWHHPAYPNLGRHHELFSNKPGESPDESAYLAYVRSQITELCTRYGVIRKFFWDVNVAEFKDPAFNELLRKLQPGIVINDRGPSDGDHSTPERHVPDGRAFEKPTEACQSVGHESWGYRVNEDYYSHKFLYQSIDKILAMGGNYLLNVGPMPDGRLDAQSLESLHAVGEWYAKVREAFTGTYPASYLLEPREGVMARYDEILLTRRGDTIYVHTPTDLKTDGILLAPLSREPKSAVLLNTGEPVEWTIDILPWRPKFRPALRLMKLPVNTLTGEVMVIRLEF